MKRAVIWIVVLVVLGAGAYFSWKWYQSTQNTQSAKQYRTAEARVSTIVQSISATGTVVPEDVVDVGSQVNGQIASFGNDVDGKPIDYRSQVQEGMVLATIDEALYQADVASGEAQLSQGRAQVQVAQASRQLALAKLEQTRRDWERSQKLGPGRTLSQADYDASKSNFEQAQAGVGVSEAQILQGQAAIASAEANLLRSRRNLAYCVIKSPVSGVIIDRRVDIGQTVVSSLNAPSLFLIAKDLTRMMVLVQVNEADIGNVMPGNAVSFLCDAFPGERFKGTVRKVRLNASVTQNVVTYTVEIVTENKELKLLPYLTANVTFELARHENVLSVPNAALRWSPTPAAATPAAAGPAATPRRSDSAATDKPASEADKPQANADKPAANADKTPANADKPAPAGSGTRSRRRSGTVYILTDAGPKAVAVKLGLSDGTSTEVASDELKEGDTIIVGDAALVGAASAAGQTNPFAPQPMGGGRRGGR